MMLIVRLYRKKENLDNVWTFVREKLSESETGETMPLYMSQLEGKPFTSVVFYVKDPEAISRFIIDDIRNCPDIEKTQTITLLKPAYFPIPKEKPKELTRYTVGLKLNPLNYYSVYDKLLSFDYTNQAFPTYISYSFGDYDMLISMLSDSEENFLRFQREILRPLEGIEDIETAHVLKSERLTSSDNWKKHIKMFCIRKQIKGPVDEDFDWSFSDLAKLTGAFDRDL